MGKKKEAIAKAITADELTEVQKYVNALQQIQMQLGGIEMQKAELMDNVKALRAELTEVQVELEKTYGDVSINLQDGTITPNDAGNKED
jgi:allophanate hydrolase subunit 1